jgi:hypothetical protein
MLVVLVLIGLASVLVAPALVEPRTSHDDALQRLIDGTRRVAIQRAQSVTLTIDAQGRWVMEESNAAQAAQLGSGTVSLSHAASLRMHVSALGVCLLDGAGQTAPSFAIDPVHCKLSTL